MLPIADRIGALALHESCLEKVEYKGVRYLVVQGDVGHLAGRKYKGTPSPAVYY